MVAILHKNARHTEGEAKKQVEKKRDHATPDSCRAPSGKADTHTNKRQQTLIAGTHAIGRRMTAHKQAQHPAELRQNTHPNSCKKGGKRKAQLQKGIHVHAQKRQKRRRSFSRSA